MPTNALIDPLELVIKKKIGSGAFGVVHLGEWRGTDVAVKELLLAQNCSPSEVEEIREQIQEEAAMMAAMRHPNIALFMGCSLKLPHLCIVTEFYSRGCGPG